MIVEFTSEGTYTVTGRRGTVYMVRAPFQTRDRSQFHGEHTIDGVVRNVIAVESFACIWLSEGMPLGLMVDG